MSIIANKESSALFPESKNHISALNLSIRSVQVKPRGIFTRRSLGSPDMVVNCQEK
jgi:hypothetical protein